MGENNADGAHALGDPARTTLGSAEEAFPALARVLEDGLAAQGAEDALRCVVKAARALLGDADAHRRPGALKTGERQYSVGGVFLHLPQSRENLLLAEENYPAAQHRLRISDDAGMPGLVLRSNEAHLIVDTDEDPRFTQILSTSRVGSSVYAPLRWQGRAVGVLNLGAQARYTYREVDRTVLAALAAAASTLWRAHAGPAWLADAIRES